MVEIKSLSKHYDSKDRHGRHMQVEALHDVTMTLEDNRRYALVGESGSGKSTLARLLLCLESPSSGCILFDGLDITSMEPKAFRRKRTDIQMVLQNAQSSLDPRVTAYESIAEPLRCLIPMSKAKERERIMEIIEKVQLPPNLLERLPHELSGGQLKRICIARAMSVSPKFIIFDESVSGLDVTIRKEILDLILRLHREGWLSTTLFITHDIDVALYMAQDIFVMKEGSIVEQIKNVGSYDDFTHEYSRLLIQSLPPKSPHVR